MLQISEEKMTKLLSKMDKFDYDYNFELIQLVFDNVNDINEYGENILHYFTNRLRDENKCLLAISSLLYRGVNPNFVDHNKYNFIQTAIETGYSEVFIWNCLKEAKKYGFNVNHQDEDGNTIIHNAILSENYHDGVAKLLNILMFHGYNPRLKNSQGQMIDDLVFESKKYDNATKRELIVRIDRILSLPQNLKLGDYRNFK